MKTPTISLLRKIELLFLNVSGINISWLYITAWMQMCYLLNLIYFIMGLNNASLFHNEQSNMWFWKKKQLHLFFFHLRTPLPQCILALKWTNLLGNLKSPQFLQKDEEIGFSDPGVLLITNVLLKMFLVNSR